MPEKTHPEYIRVGGVLYKLAATDSQVTSAFAALEAAKGKFTEAAEPEEINSAKADLAQAAKNLLDAIA